MNSHTIGHVIILYVEDDGTIRIVGSEALRDAGFVVLEAKSTNEAILLLSDRDHVGALFTDIRLPGTMDGIELAVETRKAHPKMPVLVVSGLRESNYRAIAQAETFYCLYQKKPFSLEMMVSTIQVLTSGL
jgi:DNA-binding NtrC family response regulator